MRADTSTAFWARLLNQYSQLPPAYTVPEYNVDKCNIIRASLFDSTGNCLDSIWGTYFVGFQNRIAYQNIYTVSVVTAPENLFDDEIGIYVTGDAFHHFWRENHDKELSDWPYWSANYFNKGIEWEREAHITIFDDCHNTVLSQECGIRIKGVSSRIAIPKSLRFYARENYNGINEFNADIFKTGMFHHKIVLSGGGNDRKFNLKDYLANELEQNLGFATMDFIPCAMFLDGEYWGMYYITEDYNADYIHDHYQVDHNNIIMIKNNELSEGTEEDYQRYEEMLSFILEHDMSDSANYSYACDLMDINSYIDYYAAQIYISRYSVDWPSSNIALWRTRENDGSIYGDTKWRWMLFDINSGGLQTSYLYNNSLKDVLTIDAMFASLYQNEEFRRKFAERLLYIGKEVFAPEKCNLFIDQYVQTMSEPLAASNMRFYMDDKSEEFEQYVADMRTFFEQRYDVVWDFIVQDMGEEWLAKNGIQKDEIH